MHYNSEVIQLVVGGPNSPAFEPTSTTFYVHKTILTAHSTVFRTLYKREVSMLNHGLAVTPSFVWKEAQTNIVELYDDRAADWALLCNWLYTTATASSPLYLEHDTVRASKGFELLDTMIFQQPGLYDPPLHQKVLKCLEWRHSHMKGSARRRSKAMPETQSSMSTTHSAALSINESDKTEEPRIAKRTAKLQQAEYSLKHSLVQPRPNPPALGPLIRLYILADKYGISQGHPLTEACSTTNTVRNSDSILNYHAESLLTQIVLRLKTIHKLVRVIPDREEVARVWANIPLRAEDDSLKSLILDLYSSLSLQNLTKVFNAESVGHSWHPEFLRDLLLWRYRGKNGR